MAKRVASGEATAKPYMLIRYISKKRAEVSSSLTKSKDWIDKRLRGISIRQYLTAEWQARGIKDELDYANLTAEISKATFGMTPGEYKKFKNLPVKSKANLRDNMDDWNQNAIAITKQRRN